MEQHRFILEKYSGPASRYVCPSCGKKSFVRYVDVTTGQHVHSSVGRCNHVDHCCYHLRPREYFADNNITPDRNAPRVPFTPTVKPPSLIPVDMFIESLRSVATNNFTEYLINTFGQEATQRLIRKYYIGTSMRWTGATVFWQVTHKNCIRTGKIMLYNSNTGKRKRGDEERFGWMHNTIKDFNLRQCLFGEHLLKDNPGDVGLVESEKSAIIASIYLPQLIWVATGSKEGFTADRCAALRGRTVYVYPDLKAFEMWSARATELSHIARFNMVDILENAATEEDRDQGLDIADFLLRWSPPRTEGMVRDYWSLTPVALPHYIAHPKDRGLFHREFCREYRPIDFTEFEKYSLSIN